MEKQMESATVIENAIQGKAKSDTVTLRVSDVENVLRTEKKDIRLMTIQEVKAAPICTIMWEEVYDETEKRRGQVIRLVPCVSRGDGTLVDIWEGEQVFVNKDYYDVYRDTNNLTYKRRIWSGKPTIELCKATPWAKTPVHQEDYSFI